MEPAPTDQSTQNHAEEVRVSKEHISKVPSSFTLGRNAFGFPGEHQSLVLVPKYGADKASLNNNSSRGAPGQYVASFILTRLNSRNAEQNEILFADFLAGESYLAIAKPALNTYLEQVQLIMSYGAPEGSFHFRGLPNKDGFLGKLVSDPFFAAGRDEAEKAAGSAVGFLLSNLSAQLDTPLIIELTEVTELSSEARGVSFVAPFFAVPIAVKSTGNIDDPEYKHAIALYREAINSNTAIYRFLCFYKILELSRKRRERLGRQHKAATKQNRAGELLPLRDKKAMEKWLNTLFYVNRSWDDAMLEQVFIPEALGKKINNLFDSELRRLRDRIAHGILDSGEYLLLDKLDDFALVSKWLPLMRCLARRVMKNDFAEYLEFLNEDGAIMGPNRVDQTR